MAGKHQVPISIYDKKAKSSMAYKEIAKGVCNVVPTKEEVKENWLQRFKGLFSN